MEVKRALLSCSDKTGLPDFSKTLAKLGVQIVSTGGTAKFLKDNGVKVEEVSSLTGFDEILDGRVKTLHPKIHGGLLALRDNKKHMAEISRHGIKPIDMVVVNLYPFAEAIRKKGVRLEDALEQIDIGGSTLIRAAAKNFKDVAVVVDPSSYKMIASELEKNGGSLEHETLRNLAVLAFDYSSSYDAAIYAYLSKGASIFPGILTLKFRKLYDLRYGENPYQSAAFYRDPMAAGSSIPNARQLHGKQLSYNNILDINDALEVAADFSDPTATVLKHMNPCGVASSDSLDEAYSLAHDSDPISAYGCIVSFNRKVDLKTVERMRGHFIEAIVAPGFDKDALQKLRERKNIRLLEVPIERSDPGMLDLKRVRGGLLVQTSGKAAVSSKGLKVVSKRKPSEDEIRSLLFAWKVNCHVTSNSIVLSKDTHTVGVGAGQMSRVDAVKIAVEKAGPRAEGSMMASDAFFPFRDGIDEAAKGGVKAVIQPGGSIRDAEVIDAVNEHRMAMVFTGVRCFKH